MKRKQFLINKKQLLKQNIGYRAERVKWKDPSGKINRELVFQEIWNEENRPRPGLNSGNGLLQDLFVSDDDLNKTFDGPERDDDPTKLPLYPGFVYKISPREHRIAATLIQWLGTNIGWSFLSRCIESCGYHIVEDEECLSTDKTEEHVTSKIDKMSLTELQSKLEELEKIKDEFWQGKHSDKKPAVVINTIKKINERIAFIESKRKMFKIINEVI